MNRSLSGAQEARAPGSPGSEQRSARVTPRPTSCGRGSRVKASLATTTRGLLRHRAAHARRSDQACDYAHVPWIVLAAVDRSVSSAAGLGERRPRLGELGFSPCTPILVPTRRRRHADGPSQAKRSRISGRLRTLPHASLGVEMEPSGSARASASLDAFAIDLLRGRSVLVRHYPRTPRLPRRICTRAISTAARVVSNGISKAGSVTSRWSGAPAAPRRAPVSSPPDKLHACSSWEIVVIFVPRGSPPAYAETLVELCRLAQPRSSA